jgi:predicted trehalose synthase
VTGAVARAEALTGEQLLELIVGQRWFMAKTREPSTAHVAGIVEVPGGPPDAAIAIVEVGFPEGTHELYALALSLDGDVVDGLDDPSILRRIASVAGVRTPCEQVRAMGVEQSNSTVVLDERHVLKLFRRLEAGPNPELEMLRVLGLHDFENAPLLEGWIDHLGRPLETTLVVVTALVDAVGGGWELATESLRTDPGWLPERAHRLGEVTGLMHSTLAAGSGDPGFEPEEPSAEAIPLLSARVDEQVERVLSELPELEELEPVRGRTDDLRLLVRDLAHTGPAGLFIRVHGDYHLGQVLWTTAGDWVVIDFEGEPARPLPERRRRASPLRDVAGMLRSFTYAADAGPLLAGVSPPDGWVASCREAFLAGYRSTVDSRLLPPSEAGGERLLALFELEKLLYELRYEVENRPDWAAIPVAGLARLLEA